MARFTVFYAWQSDLPRKICRDFIHDAAQAGIAKCAGDGLLEDAPRLEHDTEGVAGVPAIGDTILRRIEQCGIFLADVSLVGETTRAVKAKKKMPNPNVLFELGYAAGRIGWNRIILVMNTEFGGEDDLPFDLRFRRFPYRYKIADNCSDIEEQSEKLTAHIKMAINTMEQEEHQAVTDLLKKLDGQARHFLRQHSQASHFWETEVGKAALPGINTFVIGRLLDLGITECVPHTNDSGNAYTWTHLGKLCLRRLRLPEPNVQLLPFEGTPAPSVITDTSAYDGLLTGKDEGESN